MYWANSRRITTVQRIFASANAKKKKKKIYNSDPSTRKNIMRFIINNTAFNKGACTSN